ncbi:MAG: tRNA preQ1(34) S-adenosylmethionine ribosyltransferase-isomerase QueA [Gemmatimonadota bacterium]
MASPDLTRIEAWDYSLPEELIARYPAERRDESRLLVAPKGAESGFRHLSFRDLSQLTTPGDLLVVNESRVLPLRLLGRKPTGAPAEVLLLRPLTDDWVRWEALVRPGSKLKPGRSVEVVPGEMEVDIEESLPHGSRVVALRSPLPPRSALERYGKLPLPPYLGREEEEMDRERYQTVYARDPGSAAAPTAGLHFTTDLLDELQRGGVGVAPVTLHVGPGTFRPVEVEEVSRHQMHSEWWSIPEATAAAINQTRRKGGRIWAVGTTVVRTLESAALQVDGGGALVLMAGSGETRLFIQPGFQFQVVDALVTNFHLPRSTLLMLVAAFAGYPTLMAGYDEAVRMAYRFYSYGDAMVIPPTPFNNPVE